MSNMKQVDMARLQSQSSFHALQVAASLESAVKENVAIELKSEGTDFHTVFKNQQVALNKNKDLLVKSIVENLAARGFFLQEQVISYFSQKSRNFVAAAKNPIPAEAIIPASDVEKNGSLKLKIWPPEKIPECLLLDLDCRQLTQSNRANFLQV